MASPTFMALNHCEKSSKTSMATPRDCNTRGRLFSRLCVNRILIICFLFSLERLLFLTATISFIFFMGNCVFVPWIAKNGSNGYLRLF